MMTDYAYDELYLPLSQRVMGDMYDYAVNTLSVDIAKYHDMFMVCGMAHQFEIGNPTYVAGKNGCEVARLVIKESSDRTIDAEDAMYLDKSPEYWIGWSISYYQWFTGQTFRDIN
ncbi:MAG: XRE family transcriptional regulator, partial [Lachnospiraceae bacterium]|nr:XRE family transcriptional regulator [Lachnospiraceae bacterium]